MSMVSKEAIEMIAQSIGIPGLSLGVALALATDLDYRLREMMQEAVKCMRHSKRTILTVKDVDSDLSLKNVEKLVIQTKSVEYMPLFLSVASFLKGVCWTAYALIKFDLFITIPNGLGVMFAVVQLILYAVYYKSTQRQIAARKTKAEMGVPEVVVPIEDTGKTSKAPPKYLEMSTV